MSAEAQPAGMAVRRARQALTLEVTCLATAAAAAHTVVELAATIQSTCHFLLLLVNRRPALSTRPAPREGFTQETAGAVGPAGHSSGWTDDGRRHHRGPLRRNYLRPARTTRAGVYSSYRECSWRVGQATSSNSLAQSLQGFVKPSGSFIALRYPDPGELGAAWPR